MKYFLQQKDYELGNFVMVTPALRLLADQEKSPIPVFFETPYISDLYRICPFITVLNERPAEEPFATTVAPVRLPGESDYEAWCRILVGYTGPCPMPYADRIIPIRQGPQFVTSMGQKMVAVMHGGLQGYWQDKKTLGPDVLNFILTAIRSRNGYPLLLGSEKDREVYWKKVSKEGCMNYLGQISFLETVSLFDFCQCFISNDTGLYHVAGALGKRGLVLWKQTPFEKNKSPSPLISYVVDPKARLKVYKESIEKFLDQELLC
jgi:ADP-heptose:LPS heptosyltransferase